MTGLRIEVEGQGAAEILNGGSRGLFERQDWYGGWPEAERLMEDQMGNEGIFEGRKSERVREKISGRRNECAEHEYV
jgi:hypothetical protein